MAKRLAQWSAVRPRTSRIAAAVQSLGGQIFWARLAAQGSGATKSAVAIPGPFQGGTGTAMVDGSDEITWAGTTTGIHGTPGWFSPNSAGTFAVDKTTEGCAFMDLSTAAGILLQWDMSHTTNPTSREFIYDMGGSGASTGNFIASIGTSNSKSWLYLQMRMNGGSPVDVCAADLTTLGVVGGSRYHVATFWDALMRVAYVFIDGVLIDSAAFPVGVLPTPLVNRGCTWFAAGTTGTPSANLLNGAGSGAKVTNLLAARFDTDRSQDVPGIVEQGWNEFREFPLKVAA